MTIYHFLAISLLVTLPALAHIILKLLPIQPKNLLVTDLTLPLYALALVLVSKSFFGNSFLPHYLVLMAVLALLLTLFVLQTSKDFSYRRWFKLFWRWGFFLTLFAYLLTLVTLFTMAS